jgi:hypothetical protein
MSTGLLLVSGKTASCDFNARYTPKAHERIAGSRSNGKEADSTTTVETLNRK